GEPMAITSPSSPATSTIRPATGLSISTVALSVIMSARRPSSSTWSPTLTCQATISASAMPSPMSGKLKVKRAILRLENLVDRLADADRPGEIGPFEAVRIGGVEAGHALDRGFEVVEATLGHQRREFGAEARGAGRFVYHQATPGLFHRLFHSLDVERDERAQVEDFGVDALLAAHCLGDVDHGAVSEHRQRLPLAHGARLAQGNRVV